MQLISGITRAFIKIGTLSADKVFISLSACVVCGNMHKKYNFVHIELVCLLNSLFSANMNSEKSCAIIICFRKM